MFFLALNVIATGTGEDDVQVSHRDTGRHSAEDAASGTYMKQGKVQCTQALRSSSKRL